MSTTRVVLADDNETVRKGIRRLLTRTPEIEVVGEAGNGMEALALVKELRPDVLILDVEMPLLSGIEVARRLKKERHGSLRILALSAYADRQYIQEMLAIGVAAYMLKDDAPLRLAETILGLARGAHRPV